MLIQPIEARFIRIYPESWHSHMSMRMELYGCEIQSGKKKKLVLIVTRYKVSCQILIKKKASSG